MKVLGITGWKDQGKTTLTERLIAHYRAAGLTVSTVKHTHHGVDLDRPDTDSHRHRSAGAGQVVLASRARVAVMTELNGSPEWEVEDILRALAPADLVLIEGYKNADHPKLEVYRSAAARGRLPLAGDNPTIGAIVGDVGDWASPVPVLSPDALEEIATFGLGLAEEARR